MADEGGEKIQGRRVGQGPLPVTIPTGSDIVSEGSSVETDTDIATETAIPPTEEILRKGEEARRKGRMLEEEPPSPGALAEAAKGEVPQDKGGMEDIE